MATKLAKDLSAADLRRIGFKPDTSDRRSSDDKSTWFVKSNVRVSLDGDDGIEIFVFDESRTEWKGTTLGGLDWQCSVTSGVPADVVTSLLFKVTGG